MVTTYPPITAEEAISTQGTIPHVAHHFESAQQQFDAGKLGMWLFLVTEVLFFSGLFVTYAVYRRNHPEVFIEAHQFLNTSLGAFNTIVLLFSSLTMAWAVRCAQLGQQKSLAWLLAVTLACASLFLGVKAVEYSHKWGEGLLWAGAFTADQSAQHDQVEVRRETLRALGWLAMPAGLGMVLSAGCAVWSRRSPRSGLAFLWTALFATSLAFFIGVGLGEAVESVSSPAASHEVRQGAGHGTTAIASQPPSTVAPGASELPAAPSRTGVFFSIYYAMTGVHAIHILAGMGVIVWLLRRSLRGDFSPEYFGPVDYVGLYWHLVDLVWIYLFPLLYLIR